MEIRSQTVGINAYKSKVAPEFGVVISVRDAGALGATLVIGSPGLPNTVRKFDLGDAVIVESPDVGMVELRVTELSGGYAEVLLTKISPRAGITAAFEVDGGQNAPFSSDERVQIRANLFSVLTEVSQRQDVTAEQVELLSRKLDDIASAAERLGRKDWIMYAAGTLTNVVVGAAFAPEATKHLFTQMNAALGWVFQNALRLMGS